MENKILYKLLKQLNIPIAYQSFKSEQKLPYICILQNGSNNIGADNKVYVSDNNYNIELYTSNKDFELEKKLEELLNINEIYWNKSGDIRIEQESMTEVIYYV